MEMFKLLKTMLCVASFLSMMVLANAEGLTPAQLLMAQQAGIDVAGGGGERRSPNQPMDQPGAVAPVNKEVNNPVDPSVIERNIWNRLHLQFDVDGHAIDASQLDASQLDASQLDASQLDASQLDASQLDASQLDQVWSNWLEKKDEKSYVKPLYQFGYHFFAGQPTSFTPVTEIPVPAEYVMGPGDELKLQFYGKKNNVLYAMVDRTGLIEVPEIGSIQLVGLTFHGAKAKIAEAIRNKSVGTTVSISMGQLRSMRVFVLGDANHPGSYMVSSLSTMSNALLVSGGVSKQGSLRRIQLKRKGKLVSSLDLYDFLLRGDSRKDKRLLPGDVIFVQPVGKTIAAFGEVNRPAIYELKHEKTVSDIVGMAGGLTAHADRNHEQIERINQFGDRILLDLKSTTQTKVQAGDIVMIHAVPAIARAEIELLGQVKRPGKYGYVKGMRLNALLQDKGALLDKAYMGMALIQRTDAEQGVISVIRADLLELFSQGGLADWPVLQTNDKIYVFSHQVLNPMDKVVALGEFMKPGIYPLGKDMGLLNLVLAAGGPTDRAYLKDVEITRYDVESGERRVSRRIQVNLADVLAGKQASNIALQVYDEVLIRKVSQWKATARVALSGEVLFPSTYPVEDGEKLSSLLKRSGGFTKQAYLRGAVFTRESIRQDQQKAIDDMRTKMEAEMEQLSVSIATLSDPVLMLNKQKDLAAVKSVVSQMKNTKAKGRLVIKLEDIAALEKSEFDLKLRDGDILHIPQKPDQVLVLGQVYNTTALIFQEHLNLDDYVKAAGGVTRMADESRTYVVRANGQLERASAWGSTAIFPGDVVIVPEQLEQFNVLDSTLDWSRALMQIGVGIASFKTIGIF